jgi:hypothetical protein
MFFTLKHRSFPAFFWFERECFYEIRLYRCWQSLQGMNWKYLLQKSVQIVNNFNGASLVQLSDDIIAIAYCWTTKQ